MFSRGARVFLDIKAGSPVILLPRSAESTHMMVADLGNLTIVNQFVFDNQPGTVKYSRNRSRAGSTTESGKSVVLHSC